MLRIIGPLLSLSIIIITTLVGVPALADQPHAWGLWSQTPASPTMEQINALHTTITVIITAITVLVFGILGFILFRFNAKANPNPAKWAHNGPLEVAWTLIPVLILVAIAFPSFRLLYAMDRIKDADMTIKVTGHQWYWSYSYPDYNVSFDSNLTQDSDLKEGEPRLLTTDTHVVLPAGENIRIQLTSDDVIHSWSIPAFGVKTDAFPGRLNETWVRIEKPGLYYGQCSQLCGVNHGFMPIEVEALSKEDFAAWLKQQQQKSSSAQGAAVLADASR